jgi:tetratricopeptide (TPR) repeat protein
MTDGPFRSNARATAARAQGLLATLLEQACAHHTAGRLDTAEAMYLQALQIDPGCQAARFNVALVRIRHLDHEAALTLLVPLVAQAPDNPAFRRLLGVTHFHAQRLDLALECFRAVAALQPDDAQTVQCIANTLQVLGRPQEAAAEFQRSFALQPLITLPAAVSPPAFRTLVLFAPGKGNTPFDSLMQRATHEIRILNLLPAGQHDLAALCQGVDVVLNLVADVDQSRAALDTALALCDRLDTPVINHPRRILQTGRDTVARLLHDLPGCLVPMTRRCTGAALQREAAGPWRKTGGSPCLLRPAGSHGGQDCIRLEGEAQADAAALAAVDPTTAYYLTPFVDFRSADGFYRKYRWMFVGDQLLPYHLAIDSRWKIHHLTTEMARHAWMQDEERRFLTHPEAVFGPAARAALAAIGQRIGLDYFGIDCALLTDGRVLVFEVNACMLVHENHGPFTYKAGPVKRIREAFDTLLQTRAGAAQPSAYTTAEATRQ